MQHDLTAGQRRLEQLRAQGRARRLGEVVGLHEEERVAGGGREAGQLAPGRGGEAQKNRAIGLFPFCQLDEAVGVVVLGYGWHIGLASVLEAVNVLRMHLPRLDTGRRGDHREFVAVQRQESCALSSRVVERVQLRKEKCVRLCEVFDIAVRLQEVREIAVRVSHRSCFLGSWLSVIR